MPPQVRVQQHVGSIRSGYGQLARHAPADAAAHRHALHLLCRDHPAAPAAQRLQHPGHLDDRAQRLCRPHHLRRRMRAHPFAHHARLQRRRRPGGPGPEKAPSVLRLWQQVALAQPGAGRRGPSTACAVRSTSPSATSTSPSTASRTPTSTSPPTRSTAASASPPGRRKTAPIADTARRPASQPKSSTRQTEWVMARPATHMHASTAKIQ